MKKKTPNEDGYFLFLFFNSYMKNNITPSGMAMILPSSYDKLAREAFNFKSKDVELSFQKLFIRTCYFQIYNLSYIFDLRKVIKAEF